MYFKKILFLLVLNIFIFCMALSVTSNAVAASQISVDLVNIDTRDLLKMLAKYLNKSIVISEKISSKITVNLHGVSWREALDAVLQMQGLVKHETANVIMIATADEAVKNEQLVSQPAVFNLRYTSADNIAKLLKPAGVLSSYGKSGAEVNTNSLVVADTDDKIVSIKQLLKQIDVPAKQVLIEARIVNADENFIHELGVDLGNHQAAVSGDSASHTLALHSQRGQFNFAIAKLANNALLDLELSALEHEGRGKIISKPKLLATDRQAAYIEAGAEIPYQEKTKEGNTSTTFKKAVLSLKVTPEVVAKDAVNLSLELNQDKIGQLVVNGVPTIDTRKIHTQVLVHDNETVVLGGIYEWSKSNNITRVPFLGKIPVLGMLFHKKEIKMERKELLIFVTPRIVRERGQVSS